MEEEKVAYALALSAGNLTAAVLWLREHTGDGAADEAALRPMLRAEGFAELVARQAEIIRKKLVDEAEAVARARYKREMEGTFFDRIAELEAEGWRLFERLKTAMESKRANRADLFKMWTKVQDFAVKLRSQSAPAVSELWQAELLIRAYDEVLQRHLGKARTKVLGKEVGQRFEEMALAHEAQSAEEAYAAETEQ